MKCDSGALGDEQHLLFGCPFVACVRAECAHLSTVDHAGGYAAAGHSRRCLLHPGMLQDHFASHARRHLLPCGYGMSTCLLARRSRCLGSPGWLKQAHNLTRLGAPKGARTQSLSSPLHRPNTRAFGYLLTDPTDARLAVRRVHLGLSRQSARRACMPCLHARTHPRRGQGCRRGCAPQQRRPATVLHPQHGGLTATRAACDARPT